MTRARLGSVVGVTRGAGYPMLFLVGAALVPVEIGAQRLIDHTPNIRPEWTMGRGQPAFVMSHRFEFISGGDELLNIPTLTIGSAINGSLAIGLDFTSNSEAVPARVGGNETQYWLALRGWRGARAGVTGLLAFNSAAKSADGAITARARVGALSLLTELRGFSDAFGTGDAGGAGAVGAVLHLTPYLSFVADVGRPFRPDSLRSNVWSGGIAVAIPGTRHTFSLHAANSGATTLQGASREKVIGPKSVRYGFAFVAPLGTAGLWARVFRRQAPAPTDSTAGSAGARVTLRDIAYSPAEVRIRVGQSVQWTNVDPTAHTVTSDSGIWDSGLLGEGRRFSRVFTAAGRFPYHCQPHPHMRGLVVVEP